MAAGKCLSEIKRKSDKTGFSISYATIIRHGHNLKFGSQAHEILFQSENHIKKEQKENMIHLRQRKKSRLYLMLLKMTPSFPIPICS